MDRMPLEVQNLYTELLDRLSAIEARRSIGHVPGSFVTKEVKGEAYYYFQYSDPGGIKRPRSFLSSSKTVRAISGSPGRRSEAGERAGKRGSKREYRH